MREYQPFAISNFRTGFDEAVVVYESLEYTASQKPETYMRKERKDSIDIQGKRFGKLVAIDRIRKKNRNGLFWNCKCDCGNETLAFGGHLRAGRRVSCGCAGKDNFEKTGLNRLYRLYQTKAKSRKKQFKLNIDEFRNLVKGNCIYCGIEPSQILEQTKSGDPHIIYNGIDRIDSSLGYEIDNCASCCKRCNISKSDMNYEDWINHIKQILRFQEVLI